MLTLHQEIERSYEVLAGGGVILYPTDTIWGIGCDATNETAIEKIMQIKHREESKSLIVLLDCFDKLHHYVENLPMIAADLINCINTPLTVIYQGARNMAPSVIAEDGSVAIRIVRDEFCKTLIDKLGQPLVSTSANISGQPAPLIFHQIAPEIISDVDYAVSLYRSRINQTKASTIIRFRENGEYEIVRS